MQIFESPHFDDHEQVVFVSDSRTKLSAIIAIHSAALGPAVGGCRMWAYRSEGDAVTDALRLSKGMTYKAAISNLPIGGGKAVVIGDARTQKTPELLAALGRAIDQLGGRYVTAEDVGMNSADMACIGKATTHVLGLPAKLGGSDDPSPTTAYGCLFGIRAAVANRWNARSVDGVRIAVQGVGSVGSSLCGYLRNDGALLTVSDVDDGAAARIGERFSATVVKPDEIYDADVDVFSPCALGGVLNDSTIDRLRACIVAGGANNQLANAGDGERLRSAGILYAPDYAINAGGIIRVTGELLAWTPDEVDKRVRAIEGTILEIFGEAGGLETPTSDVADRIARRRFESAIESA